MSDLRLLTVDELDAVITQHRERQDQIEQGAWERMRIHAAIAIQPHTRKRITPRQLLQLPWDLKPRNVKKNEAPKMSKEERLKRFLLRAGKA